MARIRYLNPEFFMDEDLANLSHKHRLAFQGLWCYADREGRLEDRPQRLKAYIFPYENCDFSNILNELAKKPFIIRYIKNERKYIQILNFLKYQRPHHTEKKSEIPQMDGESTVKRPSSPTLKEKEEDKEEDKEPRTKFHKPPIEEVVRFIASLDLDKATLELIEQNKQLMPIKIVHETEAHKFLDYYESNGWRVGRNPMKDWKAAARNWMKNAKAWAKPEVQRVVENPTRTQSNFIPAEAERNSAPPPPEFKELINNLSTKKSAKE